MDARLTGPCRCATIAPMDEQAEEPRERLKLGRKQFDCINKPDTPAEAPADVREMQQANQRTQSVYEEPVDLTPRRSRRKRDYWLVMLLGNAALAALMVAVPSPAMFVYALSGMVLLSVGLTWVMWFVMSDYEGAFRKRRHARGVPGALSWFFGYKKAARSGRGFRGRGSRAEARRLFFRREAEEEHVVRIDLGGVVR